MKRIKNLLILPLVCLLLAGAAQADLIWVPLDDYYRENYERYTRVGDGYYASGPEGYLEIYDRPDGAVAKTAENGTAVTVTSAGTLEDGVTWCVVLPWEAADVDEYGYCRMEDLKLLYENDDFMADYAAELTDKAAAYEPVPRDAVMWAYPGSGLQKPGRIGNTEELQPTFTQYYTDTEGKLWGYCASYRIQTDFWICLSDPANPDLPALLPAQQEHTPAAQEAPPIPWLAIGLVAAAVAVTAVLLVRFRGSQKHI